MDKKSKKKIIITNFTKYIKKKSLQKTLNGIRTISDRQSDQTLYP